MEHGQISLRREQAALLTLGVRFFLAAALTAAQTAGGSAPFALGVVSAAGGGAAGAAAFAGTAAGALIFLEFSQALPHLAVAVLILTAAAAFRGSSLLGTPKALALTAGILSATVGGVYAAQSLEPLEQLAECLAAAALTGVSAWLFRPVLAGERSAAGMGYLAAVALMTLAEAEILGFAPARCLLCLLLLCGAYDRGALTGAAAGLGLGLTADLCLGSGVFTAALGLGGLLAGSRQGRRRSGAAGCFWLGIFGAVLLSRDRFALPLLVEAAAAAGGFLLLPARLFGGKRLQRAELPEGSGGALRDRLNKAAAAMRDLYDSMSRVQPPAAEENPAVIFDRAAERVCRSCALRDLCWQKEYTATFNAMNDATPNLLERGRALAKDFPQYFSSRCIHMADLMGAINGELSTFLLRRQYRRQLEETRRSARGQYAQLSELLSAAAAGLEAVPAFGGGQECPIGAVLRPRQGESVCGDTLTSFRREDGACCLLLADGMGSGEAARRESALTCRLLQQFLEAGIAPEAALKTLNSAMALRGAETGSFTTVDLCVFTPADGEAVLYKYGAAPSYVKQAGLVRRISGGSLPVGMRGTPAAPDVTRTRLEPGGFLVMISDGVADPLRDEWLQDLLAGWQGEDPQTLAGLILTESIRREQLQDDCGIQILYRPRPEENLV